MSAVTVLPLCGLVMRTGCKRAAATLPHVAAIHSGESAHEAPLPCLVSSVADAVIPDFQAILLAAAVGFASLVRGDVRRIGEATAGGVVHHGP